MNVLFFARLLAFGVPDITSASNLFDTDTVHSDPKTFNESGRIPIRSVTSETKATIGKIYAELNYLLSHYFSCFHNKVSEFKAWHDSGYCGHVDDIIRKIINPLVTNTTSIKDLDSFWLNT